MLTPAFEITQNENFVILCIKAPYVKANDVEIYIEESSFKFYVKPYFLRLTFPCDLIEDGRETAQYDISKGIFNISVPKKISGEFFPNLDMLTTLLAPARKGQYKTPLIEDISSEQLHIEEDDEDDDSIDEEGLCWQVEQFPEEFNEEKLLAGSFKYGFASSYGDVFSRIQNELYEVIDVQNPESTSYVTRRKQRLIHENLHFNQDHYIADLMEDDNIQPLLTYMSPWQQEHKRIYENYKKELHPETSCVISPKCNLKVFSEECKFEFTEKEKNVLLQLPNKDCLVDLLFAYAYNERTTEGENNSESAWTICKISSTLSWLDSFQNIREVYIACMRRCLCYPLYRHWLLALKVAEDVKTIICLGKRMILRCLIGMRDLLQGDENKYILNELYLNDYCVWIQKASTKKILSLANKIKCLHLTKDDLDLNLSGTEADFFKSCRHVSDVSGTESSDESESESTSDATSLDSDDESDEEENGRSKKELSKPFIEELHSNEDEEFHSNEAKVTDNKDTVCNSSTKTNDTLHVDIDKAPDTQDVDCNIICTGIEELLHIHKHVADNLDE